MCNEFYLDIKLNFAENTKHDAANFTQIGPAEVGQRLSLQTRNFLYGVEHIVKGHFNTDE